MTESEYCMQGIITTKTPFSYDINSILFNGTIWTMIKGLSEENKKSIVNSLNMAYQMGFRDGTDLMLNKGLI